MTYISSSNLEFSWCSNNSVRYRVVNNHSRASYGTSKRYFTLKFLMTDNHLLYSRISGPSSMDLIVIYAWIGNPDSAPHLPFPTLPIPLFTPDHSLYGIF